VLQGSAGNTTGCGPFDDTTGCGPFFHDTTGCGPFFHDTTGCGPLFHVRAQRAGTGMAAPLNYGRGRRAQRLGARSTWSVRGPATRTARAARGDPYFTSGGFMPSRSIIICIIDSIMSMRRVIVAGSMGVWPLPWPIAAPPIAPLRI